MVRAITLEKGSILQEHSTGLEDESDKQLHVDVVPGTVEPSGRDRRDESKGLAAKELPGARNRPGMAGKLGRSEQLQSSQCHIK